MKITKTNIAGCIILEPKVFEDNRGIFFESFNKKELEKYIGKPIDFVQDNHSVSNKGVLRGLHFQNGKFSQAKLVRVVRGEVLDVVVDIRMDSPSFGSHFKIRLSELNRKMIYIPKGMAHGFLALANDTVFMYKCDEYYNKQAESGIMYNDPDLNIDWEFPARDFTISEKDQNLPLLKDLRL